MSAVSFLDVGESFQDVKTPKTSTSASTALHAVMLTAKEAPCK